VAGPAARLLPATTNKVTGLDRVKGLRDVAALSVQHLLPAPLTGVLRQTPHVAATVRHRIRNAL
ncbi:hypothetical protein, partial [Actinomyces israelii]|uniref:hypothetical protein n=1 Tax=Actinomyces israelii TaxID=1659 RepID=UPI002356497F